MNLHEELMRIADKTDDADDRSILYAAAIQLQPVEHKFDTGWQLHNMNGVGIYTRHTWD